MKDLYFNKHEFLQILSLADVNPYLAKEKYEEYLKKYPQDYRTYCFYAGLLITLQEFDEAIKVFSFLEDKYQNDKNYILKSERISLLKTDILYDKLKLLCYTGRYEEAYQLCLSNEIPLTYNLESIIFYCRKQLGKLDTERREPNSYLFRQIVDYQEEDFLEHIKKHLADYNMDLDNPNKNIFVPEFDILKVVEEIKKYIPSKDRLCSGFIEDVYVFKMNECGRVDNKLANYFKVVCLHDTKDFITMCPVLEGENLPYIDINYLKEEKETSKVKRISQTEKFYQRYKYLK